MSSHACRTSSVERRDQHIRELLDQLRGGDRAAWDRLVPLMYGELRACARWAFENERRLQTLQPTDLVGEAYLRLLADRRMDWEDRLALRAAAARAMRQALVAQARRRGALRRGGDRQRLSLHDPAAGEALSTIDLLSLEDGLQRLGRASPRSARALELRYYGGLDAKEIGQVLGVSERTVKGDWRAALAWLRSTLHADGRG